MIFLQRTLRPIFLIALFIIIATTQAQDDITVVGSAIVQPVLQDVADFGEMDITLDLQSTGTRDGFAQFCAGEAAMQTASRAINLDEETACVENEVEYFEFIIGYDIVAFIGNSDDDFLACLTNTDINTFFAPSAASEFTDWSSLNPTDLPEDAEPPYPELEVTVMLPEANTLTNVTLDNIVNGIGFRDDAELADFDTIIETVSTTEGAIGVVPLRAIESSDAPLTILDVSFDDVASGCQPPAAISVDNRLYSAATPLYVYVNQAQAGNFSDYLDLLLSEEANTPIAEAGFSPISPIGLDTNLQILSGEISGRLPEDDEESFVIPPVLEGEVNIGGTSFVFGLADSVGNSLAATQETFTVNVNTLGEASGIEDLCAGEIDMTFSSDAVTCEDDTAIVSIPLGTQVAVLVGNLEDDYTTCLTTEQISTIWGSPATETITNWSDLGEPLPDQDMTLFGIREGNLLSELLLFSSEGTSLPVRIDTEIDNDPLYRAAATANVTGALTYMSWEDYNEVLENEQTNIQIVSVDGGSGCVEPTEETIADGSYPLSMPVTLNVGQLALANVNVQSVVWSLFSDNNFRFFQTDYIVGLNFEDLPAIRDDLAVEFNIAATAALEAQAEGTAEPDAEVEEAPADATETTEETSDNADVASEAETDVTEEDAEDADATEEAEPTADMTEAVEATEAQEDDMDATEEAEPTADMTEEADATEESE